MTDSEGNEIGKLFVGGLSQATNNGSLRLYFSRFGEVDDAVVMMDNKTGRSRGFGYVKYRESESVNLALEAKPHILDGKEVDAKQCNVNMKGRNRRSLKIFVGGIGLDQDAESIRNFFNQFGRVTDVNLMMDSNKQRHRGFAFVGFEDESVVKRLIGLHYVMMSNKQVEIKAMEPPNFGRKIGPHTCLATATLMTNASPGDSACVHAIESSPDSGGILAAGMGSGAQFANNISYLSPQSPGISCIPSNIRTHSSGLYEASPGTFDNSLENLYPATAFLQPVNHTTGMTEPVQAGVPVSPYLTSKQSVPLLVTNGQYHPSIPRVQQNSSSLYTTLPYQIISPTFIPQPTQQHQQPAMASLNQVVGTSKSTTCWPPNALQASQLTLCSSQIPSANNLVACQQPLPNLTQADMTGGLAPIVTPYYALCPQYTTISLGPDQPVCPSYTFQTPSGLIGANMTPSSLPNGTGDTTSSRPCSPANDTRLETSALSGSTPKVVYPTILMTAPGSIQNPAPGHTIPLGQTLWNQTHPSLFYPSVPLGWTIQPSPTGLTSQHQQPGSALSSSSTKVGTNATRREEETDQGVQEETNGMKQSTADSTKLVQTQASGDSMDSLAREQNGPGMSHGEYNMTMTSSALFKCSRPQAEPKQPNDRPILETETWQLGENLHHLSAASSWSNTNGATMKSRWEEGNNKLQLNVGYSTGQLYSNSWNLPVPFTENPATAEEKASKSNRFPMAPSQTENTSNGASSDSQPGVCGTSDTICHRIPVHYQILQTKAMSPHSTTPSQLSPSHPHSLTQSSSAGRSPLRFEDEVRPKVTGLGCDTDTRTDCARWMYAKSTGTGHTENNTGDTKDLNASPNIGVELECQGPAGAAGDFHLASATVRYSGYRATR